MQRPRTVSRVHARKPDHCRLQNATARVSRACVGAIERQIRLRLAAAWPHAPFSPRQTCRVGCSRAGNVKGRPDIIQSLRRAIRSPLTPNVDMSYRRSLICDRGGMGAGCKRVGTYFQIRARISPLPVAKIPPVGLGATEMTASCQLTARKRPHLLSFWRMRPSLLGTA